MDGVTGFLRPPTAAQFAAAMRRFVGADAAELKHAFGEAGSQCVQQCFSFDAFTDKLDRIFRSLCSSSEQ